MIKGRIGVLFALGVGFNNFSGRDNARLYLNVHAPQLSTTELDDAIEDIIDFADLKSFLIGLLGNIPLVCGPGWHLPRQQLPAQKFY